MISGLIGDSQKIEDKQIKSRSANKQREVLQMMMPSACPFASSSSLYHHHFSLRLSSLFDAIRECLRNKRPLFHPIYSMGIARQRQNIFMGLLDSFIEWLGLRRRDVSVLVVGLDNSGKSSLLNFLRPREAQSHDIAPTVGFNVEHFQCKGLSFSAFDMSGQNRYRTLWENYYRATNGIIFVVDSSDRTRIVVARDELEQLLKHPEIASRNVPILFFANKMDVRDALSDVGVSAAMGLDEITNKSWHICSSDALRGDGVAEGIDWLSTAIKASLDQARRS